VLQLLRALLRAFSRLSLRVVLLGSQRASNLELNFVHISKYILNRQRSFVPPRIG
jgi:hypothetical protein